ncbi:MAG: glycosyltransferase family 2 protein [Candidatus Omnitrophota bacterium]
MKNSVLDISCKQSSPEPANPKVSIIILNWNGAEDTIECLNSVEGLSYPNYDIIVVDNGSVDGSRDLIKKTCPRVTVLSLGVNLGYAGGNNAGIKYAMDHGADYVLILNNDTVIDSCIINEFIKSSEKHKTAGIFGAKIYYYNDPACIWFGRAKWNEDISDFNSIDDGKTDACPEVNDVHETDYVCGCAMFIRASLIKKIGLFDESFFLCWEETDFCERAKRAGLKCLFVPTAKVWHKIAVSFKGESSPQKIYFNTRNKLLWAKRNLSLRKRWAVYRSALKELLPSSFEKNNFSFIKNIYWDILRIKKNRNSPIFKARISGIKDFVFRRYGNKVQVKI